MRKDFPTCMTRTDPSRLQQLIETFDDRKIQAIKECGFEFLLNWNVGAIPLKLTHWLLTISTHFQAALR